MNRRTLKGGCLSRADALQIQNALEGRTGALPEDMEDLQRLIRTRIEYERQGFANDSVLMAVLDRRIQEIAWGSGQEGGTQNFGNVGKTSPTPYSSQVVLPEAKLARAFNSEILHHPEAYDIRGPATYGQVQCTDDVDLMIAKRHSEFNERLQFLPRLFSYDLSQTLSPSSSSSSPVGFSRARPLEPSAAGFAKKEPSPELMLILSQAVPSQFSPPETIVAPVAVRSNSLNTEDTEDDSEDSEDDSKDIEDDSKDIEDYSEYKTPKAQYFSPRVLSKEPGAFRSLGN